MNLSNPLGEDTSKDGDKRIGIEDGKPKNVSLFCKIDPVVGEERIECTNTEMVS
jgi:hypothetical protein